MNWYKKAQESDLQTHQPANGDQDEFLKFIEEMDRKEGERWKKVDSSFVDQIAYNDNLGFLDVKLKNGSIYSYKKVPRKVFDDFLRAKSKGDFYNRIIKKKYKLISK